MVIFINNKCRLIGFAGLWLFIWFFSSVAVQAQTYCTPTIPDGCSITATWADGHWVSHVQLGTINDYPLNSNCTIYDHTNLTTDITAGVSTPMTVETGGYVGIGVYVDFNNDGDFDDTGEFLEGNYIGNATSIYNFNITIPLSVPQGSYRMRVLGIWAWTGAAGYGCNVFTSYYSGGNGFGNFYDYILNVIQPCPTITGSAATPAVVCYGGSSLLSASASISGSIYYWYSSATGGSAIDSGSTYQTPALTHNTTYYVSAKYNGCASDPRTAINIDVQPPLLAPQVLPADMLLCSGSVATLMAVKSTASDTATIGTGTNGDVKAPVDGTKTYSQSQLIYTQAEMGSIGSFPRKITGISFYKNSGVANTSIGNVSIYMSYTAVSQVGTILPNFNPATSAYALVYSGAWPNSAGANNWINVPLATPFPGPGAGLNQNLSVIIVRENQVSNFINAPRFAFTDMTSANVYRCGYNSGNTVLTTALTQTYHRPNIKLSYSFQPDVSWTPVSGLFKDYALGNSLNATDTNSTVYTNVPGTYHVSVHWQGCSSASDSSLITILPPIPADTIDTTICNGESFTFNGQPYSQSTTLTDTFQSVHGCDSVVGLDLTVLPAAVSVTDTIESCWSLVHNGQTYMASTLLSDTLHFAGYGCDSAYLNTYLLIHPVDTQSLIIDTAGCSSVVFEGQTYTTSAILNDTFSNQYGCDSIYRHVQIMVYPPIASSLIDTTICSGESFTFNGQTYTVSTNLTDTFQSVHGCDSVVALNLTVLPAAVSTTDTVTGCWSIVQNGQTYTSSTLLSDTLHFAGYGCDSAYLNTYLLIHPVDTQSLIIDTAGCSSVAFEGQTYTTSAILNDTFSNQYGCDSIYRHVQIMVYPPIASSLIDTTICSGESFTFNGQTYTASTTLTDTFSSVHGCDSVVGLHLMVLPAAVNATDTIAGCWSVVHNGQTYTSSTLLSDTLQYAGYGCDSAYLNTYLWVHPADTQSVAMDTAGCSSVVFEGQTYTSSQALLDTVSNQYGCDSIYRHIHITVYPPVAAGLIDTTICNGESFAFNGQAYTQNTALTDTFQSVYGCDSVVGLHLTVLPAAVNATDTIAGCWSVVHNGQTYTSSTLLSDTLQYAGYGCDSAYLNTYLWVHPADTQSVAIDTAGCSNVLFNGQTYTTNTTLLDTISNQYGCDSVYRHVQVMVYPPVAAGLIDTTICNGESFAFNGQTYTQNTALTDTFQSVYGCDSVVGLHLTVLPAAVNATDTIAGCWSVVHNGQTYTSPTLLSDTLQYAGYGCDSAYLNTYLWVHPADTQSVAIDTAGCSNVLFNGQTYTSNTTLLDTISNQYGCDSIYRHIQITVYNSTLIQKDKDTAACDELSLLGHTYYQNATIDTMYKNVHGCDSLLLKIRILINHSARDTITASICRGASYLFNGQEYMNNGVYSASFPNWNGCDSISVLVLQVHELPDVAVDILVPPVQFCEGNPVVLQASGAMSYHWLTDYGKDYGSGDSMSIIMVKPDIAVMTIGTDGYGCTDTTITNLHSEPCCTIFMPNVFTPNGDGKNDLFGPGANGSFSEYRLEVFNRYGQRIFVAFNKDDRWDGTIGGQPAATGTYFYRVMAKCMDGKSLIKQGDLILIR